MTFIELYNELSRLYPDALRCEWDNDGIMCADRLDRPVKKVLVALDVTKNTVKHAIENGFDTIISHHPLVFKSQKSLTPTNYTQNKLIELIKGNVAVMSFHTRLDAASGGVNDTLCHVLGLQNIVSDPTDPVGRIATINTASLQEFASGVKASLGAPFVLYSGNKDVNKVYVVGGDGKELIQNAIDNGCDTLITGRASYNTAIDAADMGLNIVEAGHFYTENPICCALKSRLSEIDATIEVDIYNSNEINCI